MDRWLIALTVPLFFLLIAVEWLWSRRLNRRVYRFGDSIASLATGILQQVGDLWLGVWALAVYAFLFEHLRVAEPSMSEPWHWLLAALGVDFLYYWFHRASHRINLLWAAHVVHHQSEEYNLTTALRQSAVQPFYNAMFFAPLALLGVPPEAVLVLFTADVLYQFWIHTRLIPALGPLEYVLCTPSNHRVHHGIDPEYIDKNYGGVLIIWDRLFGTYRAEAAEPNFGTVSPLRSWNPFWANVSYYGVIWTRVRASRGAWQRLWALFAPPEWLPESLGGRVHIPAVDRKTRPLYDPPTRRSVDAYLGAQYAWVVTVLLAVMVTAEQLGQGQRLATAAWIAASITGWAGLLEGKTWARPMEAARLGAAPLLALSLDLPRAAVVGVAIFALAMAVWFFRLSGPQTAMR